MRLRVPAHLAPVAAAGHDAPPAATGPIEEPGAATAGLDRLRAFRAALRLRSTKFTTLIAGAAALAAAVLVPAGPAAATAQRDAAAFTCPKKYLCVHVFSTQWETYSWRKYYACTTHDLGPNYFATWYINNQTAGTRALFTWDDAAGPGDPPTYWYTPYPVSKGRPPAHAADESITVCA